MIDALLRAASFARTDAASDQWLRLDARVAKECGATTP
ncbi:hypothetical protein FHW12_002202 [Dokdonella fugitiva]|uniref:Uncharacterized protein n=1 Tax=Dokdonella fugitiva TaxID=328517 RepID=A0A839F369_9GAMM|nr:hypothetical protein [Dokdonella fugitiva]